MNPNSSNKLLYADYMRVIATMAMILLHGAGDLLYDFTDKDMYNTAWWTGNIIDSGVRWCVPVFVMLSGSLLLSPSKEEAIGDFLQKRMLRVAIPFLFWAAVYLAYDYRGYIRDGKLPWWPDIWYQFLFKDVYFHLWFVPMILGLYFLVPTFRVFLKAAKRIDIEYFLMFWFYVSIIQVNFGQFFLVKYIGWLAYIGYLVMGYYLRTYDIKNKKLLYWTGIVSYLITVIGTWYTSLYFHGFTNDNAVLYMYLSPNVIFMGCALFVYLRNYDWQSFINRYPNFNRFIQWFAGLSFGVYLVHALLLDVFKNGYLFDITISSTKFFNIPGHPIWCVPMYVIITTSLSIAIIWILSKVPYLGKLVN